MSKRLLFLDFDGVLHSESDPQIEYDGPHVDITGQNLFIHAIRLAELLSHYPDVDIIISSSWRNHFPLVELQRRLGVLGHRAIGTTTFTKDKYQAESRGISRYRQCERMAIHLGIDDWIMLDDDVSVVFPEAATPEMQCRVIFCDPILGLGGTATAWDRLAKWLAGQPHPLGEGDLP